MHHAQQLWQQSITSPRSSNFENDYSLPVLLKQEEAHFSWATIDAIGIWHLNSHGMCWCVPSSAWDIIVEAREAGATFEVNQEIFLCH